MKSATNSHTHAALIELAATWCEAAAKASPGPNVWLRRAEMLREGYQPQTLVASETARIYKKPAECAVACPPQQVCDYCQSQPKDKPAELAPSPNTTDDVFKTALREIVAPILEHKPGGLPAMMDLVDKVLAAVRKHAAIVALLEDRADQRNAP